MRSTMSKPESPPQWQTLYVAAMLEPDSAQVALRIRRANEAIQARLRELPQAFSVSSEQERLQSALKYLCRLEDDF
jgi:hypothetical protein